MSAAASLANLEPVDSSTASALARRPRVKPRSLVLAIVGYERSQSAKGHDLPAEFGEEYWNVLRNSEHRHWPFAVQHYTTHVDPRTKALRADANALALASAPRIVIVGPQTDISSSAPSACIDVSASIREPVSHNADYPKLDNERTDDVVATLREQVQAQSAQIAQLASMVQALLARSATSETSEATINAPLPRGT